MENYDVTIAYKAVITLPIKAKTKEEAEEVALRRFTNNRGFKDKQIVLQDDSFSVEGVLNISKTWDTL